MAYVRLSIVERLSVAKQQLSQAKSHGELATLIAKRSYTPEKIADGELLLADAATKHDRQFREYGEQFDLTDTHNRKLNELRDSFVELRDISKVVFKGDRLVVKTMLLDQPIARTQNALSEQVRSTIGNMLKTDSILERLAPYGFDEPTLDGMQKLLGTIETFRTQRDKEVVDAQDATRARDEAMEKLDEWMVDFQTIARIAVRQRPELMELLGDTVR